MGERSLRKVLIVDDDENIRDSLREAFGEEGYDVATASNGREAVDLMTQSASRPDVVILDLLLPAVDGGRVYEDAASGRGSRRDPRHCVDIESRSGTDWRRRRT